MDKAFATELVRRIAPVLRGELAIQPVLPLEIKLHLERLKLTELIRDLGDSSPGSIAVDQAELHVA